MTIAAFPRQFVLAMKEVQPFFKPPQIDVRADSLVEQFDALPFRNNRKAVRARLQRQPEVQVGLLLPFHDDNRLDELSGFFNPDSRWP